MRILVEILHPAHVHCFRNAIAEWRARGDEVLVLSREKDVANDLLEAYSIPYRSISRLGSSKLSLITEMVQRDARMLWAALRFKPDVLVGIMGVTIVQVGKIIGKPAIVFYDTENAKVTNRFVYPLAPSVCTPECYSAPVQGNHITYPGYHELAYLHPDRFEPDAGVVGRAGIDASEEYFVLRFVSWQASHDVGERGFTLGLKRELVALLQEHGRVLISSEQELPADLEELRFSRPPAEMHHFLGRAKMLIGESATMASEAAVMGVPACYIADTGRGYTDELQERYGLVWNFGLMDAPAALTEVSRILSEASFSEQFAKKHARMLEERVDTTQWLMAYVDSVVAPG